MTNQERDEKIANLERTLGPKTGPDVRQHTHGDKAALMSWIMAQARQTAGVRLTFAGCCGLTLAERRALYLTGPVTFADWARAIAGRSKVAPLGVTPRPEPVPVAAPAPVETAVPMPEALTESAPTVAPDGPKAAPARADSGAPAQEASALMAQALALLSKGAGLDADRVREIARAVVAEGVAPHVIIIDKRPETETKKDQGVQHWKYSLLWAIVRAGVPVALVGGAGSGKTTAAENVSKALTRPFFIQSFCNQSTKTDLLGYQDASGKYRGTPWRSAYENGGVWCGDEFDAGNANVSVVLNAGLANGVCAFPGSPEGIIRHADFVPVVCMNTYGSGGSRIFVGRNEMDGATKDRFAFVTWDVDPALESAMLGLPATQAVLKLNEGGVPTAEKWLTRVRTFRAAVEKAGVRHIISPRASLYGVKMAAHGIGAAHLEECLLVKGMDVEQLGRVRAAERAL